MSTQKPTNAMEWDVGPGRGTAEGGASNTGTGVDTDAYPPFRDDEESVGTPAFNLDLKRFIIGAWQRKHIAVLTIVILTVIFALLIHFSVSKQWQASTALIKRSHQDRLTLADRNPFKAQDYSLATLLDTLKLPSSLAQVREQAAVAVNLTTLAQAIDVSLGRESKIINLSVTWTDPEKAAELANLVAGTFVNRTRVLLADDASKAFEYYSAQLEETRKTAKLAAADVQTFRQKYGISNLDTETKVLLEEMSRIQANLNSRVAEADALKVAAARLSEDIKKEPEQVITFTVYKSPLQTRLADYEWELQEALSKYTELNPKVIKLNERIDSLKRMIAANNDEAIPENTYALNSKREEMQLREQTMADDIKLREAQATALQQTMDSMQAKVAMLSDWEKDYLVVQSRLDGILALEKELSRRVEETRLVIQRQDASFDVVEAATVPVQALPSGRKLMAAAAVIFSMGSGLFFVLFLEWRDPLVRSKRDVTDIIGVDTCGEIPASVIGSDSTLSLTDPSGKLANLYRGFSNDLDASLGSDKKLPIAILSIGAGAGRSTVAANLVATRIIKGQKVLLVEADLRPVSGPGPAELLQLEQPQSGLYEHLLEGTALSAQSDQSGLLQHIAAKAGRPTDEKGMFALAASNLTKMLKPFQRGRYTMVDLPPLEDMEVSLEMAGQLELALLVVRSGETRRDDLKRTMAQLNKRGIECVASIVLGVPEERLESAKLFPIETPDWFIKLWSKTNLA